MSQSTVPKCIGLHMSESPTLQKIHISHQTGSSENHRLKMPNIRGICDRSLEGMTFHYNHYLAGG